MAHYDLACLHASDGELDEALEQLEIALRDPSLRILARQDEALAVFRDPEDAQSVNYAKTFKRLVGDEAGQLTLMARYDRACLHVYNSDLDTALTDLEMALRDPSLRIWARQDEALAVFFRDLRDQKSVNRAKAFKTLTGDSVPASFLGAASICRKPEATRGTVRPHAAANGRAQR